MGGNKVVNFLRKYMMLIAMVVVVIIFYNLTDGRSLLPQNVNNVISQNAYVFVLGTGMLLCILTGGNIDLSVGSVVCLAGGVGAILMDKNIPWPVAVIAMLVMGLLVGMWHGYWIAYVKVPPFIATLVGMLAFRGLANIIMKGLAYSLYQEKPNQAAFLKIFGGGDSCYIPGSYIPDKIAHMRAGFINQQITGSYTTDLNLIQQTINKLQGIADAGQEAQEVIKAAEAAKQTVPEYLAATGTTLSDASQQIFADAAAAGKDVPAYLAAIGKTLTDLKIYVSSQLNVTCLVVGILIAVGFVVFTIWNRKRLIKKGYKVDSLATVIIKTTLIFAVILWLTYKFAGYKGIPTVLIWIAIVLGLFAYITSKTTLGRNLYAVGGNEKATRLSGINTKKVMFSAYTLMGVLAGFAGVLNIARQMGSQPTYGAGYEMDAIAACFIGGASAYGGTGSIGGVIIGAALCGIINQGMVIAKTPTNYQTVVKGLVLLVAVLFDVIMQMRRKGAKKAKKASATQASATEKGGANA